MKVNQTKQEFLLKLRRCMTIETLDKVIEHNKYSLLTSEERENFISAADHRLAELTIGRNFDRIPAGAWKLVR